MYTPDFIQQEAYLLCPTDNDKFNKLVKDFPHAKDLWTFDKFTKISSLNQAKRIDVFNKLI